MKLKITKPFDNETADEAPGTARMNGSPRSQEDSLNSFNRRFAPQGRNSAPPGTESRALAHRPSPLVLSPLPPSGFSYDPHSRHPEHGHGRDHHDRDGDPGDDSDRARDSRSRTPGSTAYQMVRKRPAPLVSATPISKRVSSSDHEDEEEEDEEARDSQFDGTLAQTPGSADIHQAEDSICLCRRAPKVPRPRNVFMLYRQNYQSDVVARNPGIANPDISKIIGRMWRELNDTDKAYWKQRAEEEKIRHRQQYPDYRYQPRRARRGDASGDRPGSASSVGGENGNGAARGGDTGDGSDPNHCEKCGRRFMAPPPSARSIPSSARTPSPPPSPFGSARGGMQSASLDGFDVDGDRSRALFPSPGLRPHQSPPRGQGSSSREVVGRRPLPPHGRPVTVSMGPRGHPRHQYEDLHTPSDQKRRRYDPPTPFSARFSPYGNGDGSAHPSYNRLPHRPGPYNDSLSLPQMPHSASLPEFSSSGPAPSPASPWMGPPPPPMRHPTRAYAGHPPPRHGYDTMGEPPTPASGHPARGEVYGVVSGRLPPPTPQGGYGYYPVAGPNGAATPSTGMASPSMRQAPTPTAVGPAFDTAMDFGRTIAINRERLLHQKHLRPTSGFTDESLKLPPLMTDVPPALQAAHRRLSESGMATVKTSSSVRGAADGRPPVCSAARNNGPPTGRPTATPAHFQDMRAFASSPTPIMTRLDDDKTLVDKDSQASGVRAMVMSVSYVKKFEVLRRICPPRPMPPRRGPIIAIEGHNATLREAVGRIVDRALVSSGECNVRIWTMAPSADKEADGSSSSVHGNVSVQKSRTDSGIGSIIHDEDVNMTPSPESGSDCNSRRGSTSNETARPGSLSFTVSTIEDLMQLAPAWHKISSEMLSHIYSVGGGLGTSQSTATGTASVSMPWKDKERAPGPPSPRKSPMAMQYSPASLSPAMKNAELPRASEDSRMSPASGGSRASANSSALASPRHSSHPPVLANSRPRRLLPVALLTTGYSLAISDKCAISVPINDSYPPVAHWEFMATLWRGTPGPDLVVYADASPPPPTATGACGPTVSYIDQEGILVVHIPPSKTAVNQHVANVDVDIDIDSDGSDDRKGGWATSNILDQKTERRLTFEILELVRSGNFGVIKEEA